MKAIQITEFGDADQLKYVDLPDPVAGPGGVLVQVKAAGVNFADIYSRKGQYPGPDLPRILGQEGAGIVAQALGNQKLVLDQITALNTTTSGLIERTSQMLKDNSVRIQEQAATATIGLPQLQAAFTNIYETMDAIDTFKGQALDSMAATIGTLEAEVAKSQSYLDRVRRQDERVAAGSLDLDLARGAG